MDNRIFILPIASAILVSVALFNSTSMTGQITGNAVSGPGTIEAQIRVTIGDGIIPEGSLVVVEIANHTSGMNMTEFIEKSGSPYKYGEGSIPEIGFEGPGYLGPGEYTLDLEDFGLNLVLEPGNYTLSNSIYYDDFLLSYTEETVTIV